MPKIELAITGLGNVGRRLLELIDLKCEILHTRFNLDFVIAGICDTSGALIDPHGLKPADVIAVKEQKKGIATLSGGLPGMTPAEFVHSIHAGVLVELTLTNLKNGEPGLGAIRSALRRKMNVVTANKGPLVLAYSELANSAKSNSVQLLHSATVTGGLPTLNIGMRDLGVASINKVEGILNGTTNYILTRMAEGESYANALKHAQDAGNAEADPSLDVDGWDAACKLVIIANAVLRRPTKLKDVSVEGIRSVTSKDLELAASRHQVIKLIAVAERKGNDYQLSVRPTILERSHPLAVVSADMMAVIYHTDINGTIFASSEEPDPYPTAAAVLRDIVHIVTA
jgi:homoserine dehydrogenase